MDFIEQIFGVSPDHGDGSLEIIWVAAMVVAIVAIVLRRRIVSYLSARTRTRRD